MVDIYNIKAFIRANLIRSEIVSMPLDNEINIYDYANLKSFSKDYLYTYYHNKIDFDELEIARFLVRHYSKIRGKPKMLELGCGPTIHHVIPAVPYVSEIHMSDFLPENRNEIINWIKKKKHSHNWSHFTKKILELEGKLSSRARILEREQELRSLITKVEFCDVLKPMPLQKKDQYPVVGFFYVAEEVAINIRTWRTVMKRVGNIVSPGGHLFLSALYGTHFYTLRDKKGFYRDLPTAYILKKDIYDVLKACRFDMLKTTIKVVKTPDQKADGIQGVIIVSAKKLL